MTSIRLSNRIQFQVMVLAPFGVLLFLLAWIYGCQSQPEPAKEEPPGKITLENLQTAYAKSIKNQRMYERFVIQAEKEKLKNVANLYRALTRSEAIHAANHAALMRSRNIEPVELPVDSIVVGTTLQTLKMALSSEEMEVDRMYPNLANTAKLEKFAEAAAQFELTLGADSRHVELLKDAHDRLAKIGKVPYFVCIGCGYILTSEKTQECPGCGAKKETFEKV